MVETHEVVPGEHGKRRTNQLGGGAIKEDFTGEGSLEMKLKDEADVVGGTGKRETRKRQELSGSTKGRSHPLKGC